MPAPDEDRGRIGIVDILAVEWTREGVRVLVKTEAGADGPSPCELLFPDVESLAKLCELLVRVGIVGFQSGAQRKTPLRLDQLSEG